MCIVDIRKNGQNQPNVSKYSQFIPSEYACAETYPYYFLVQITYLNFFFVLKPTILTSGKRIVDGNLRVCYKRNDVVYTL